MANNLPKHIDKITDPKRKAVAPYNFVELPDKVVEAQALPDGDRYWQESEHQGNDQIIKISRHTGKIECTLTTSSPLYIRCGLDPLNYEKYGDKYPEEPKSMTEAEKRKWETDKKQWEEEKRNILAPFFNNPSSDYPSIAASSLRGMLRTLVEIVSFSKIDKVADQKLVYRAFADVTSLGDFYRDRLMQSQDEDSKQYSFLMQAGYIVQDQGVWKIQPAQEISQGTSFARIEKSQISKILKKPWHGIKHAKKVDIWIDSLAWHPHRGGFIELYYAKVNPSSSGKKSSGVLVETQGLANKKMEYVFGLPDDSAKPILIPDSKENPMLQNYEEQMTKEQKEFLGKEGVLRNMHPVFYLIENDELVFFGHTMMFRLPYRNSVRDFIPDCISTANNPDLVESIFGFVRDSKHIDKEQSLSGRVFFTDAVTTDNDIWLAGNSTESITPHILGSPKPTTFQHYLVQSKEEELKHYEDELDKSAIRGHKLYWHKKDVKRNEIEQTDKNEIKKVRSQYTDIKPVKEGVEFKFDIYFENLSDVELGSLLWILDISQDEKYRLSLGMGKPLGMGAIKITHELYLSNRKKRYENLFDQASWNEGYSNVISKTKKLTIVNVFEKYILGESQQTVNFRDLQRIKMLLAMLSWTDSPSHEQTRYMEIKRDTSKPYIGNRTNKKEKNEYSERPILPDPLQIIKEANDKL